MSIICKLFIQHVAENPDGTRTCHLGAVCRGEENKDWAAATPGATLVIRENPVLAEVWDAKRLGTRANAEVFVRVIDDPKGDWVFEGFAWQYGGGAISLRQDAAPYGKFTATVNAKPATAQLRATFANALVEGTPARYRIECEPAE